MGKTAAAAKEPPKFLRVADVAAMLDISESHAYKIMRQLNKELEAKGKIVTPAEYPGDTWKKGCIDGR